MRWILLLCVTLAACAKGPQADLPTIGQARSLAAEWALVNDQASQGKLTATYVKTMRESIREQLRTSQKSLTEPHSGCGSEIEALLSEPEDASPDAIRTHATKLKQVEDSLESA